MHILIVVIVALIQGCSLTLDNDDHATIREQCSIHTGTKLIVPRTTSIFVICGDNTELNVKYSRAIRIWGN